MQCLARNGLGASDGRIYSIHFIPLKPAASRFLNTSSNLADIYVSRYVSNSDRRWSDR